MAARRERLAGRVTVKVAVTADGRVESAEVVGSSGHRELDEAAVRALRRARYKPARRGTAPVPGTKIVAISFRLDDR